MHKIDISIVAQSALAIIAAVSITDIVRDVAKELHPARPMLGAFMRLVMIIIVIFAIILIFNEVIMSTTHEQLCTHNCAHNITSGITSNEAIQSVSARLF